jgi:RND family efflux transporter MFP subunit
MPVVDLAEDQHLRLSFPVPESAVPRMQVGAPVEFTVPATGKTSLAKVSRFTGKVDRSTRTMLAEVDVENPDLSFKPGMLVEVSIILRESRNAAAIPMQALSTGPVPDVLLVEDSGMVRQVPVQLGLQTAEFAEVTRGLKVGDQVVVGTRSGITAGHKVISRAMTAIAAH